MTARPPLAVERWGLVPHPEAEARLDELVARVASGEEPSRLILLEHPAVITFGVRGDREADLLAPPEELERLEVGLSDSPRGGQATLHSPGQLVAWFAYRLPGGRAGLGDFLRTVERLVVEAFADLGTPVEARRDEVGFWIPGTRRKIASMGLRVHEGVASRGVGANVANDLSLFRLLRPCGLSDARMTRLADEAPPGIASLGAREMLERFARRIEARAREAL